MIVDGQCYIVIAPGMERPEDAPERVEYFNTHSNQWTQRTFSGTLGKYDTYRYPVSEAVYKAHHWCIAYGVEVPEGYEVVGFYKYYGRDRMKGLFGLVPSGEVCTDVALMHSYERPILRKKPCEHGSTVCQYKYDGDVAVGYECLNCGMVRKLGDWERGESNV